ncbi:MAG TPA: VWA domain-containing protein [Acidimicrobiales bacterium]|nr:VWA domain-containing protein [Acidimicrobiales bacterium]
MTARFPFTAVVGQDEAKVALLLNAVDPAIGGVLMRGHKGSAKTTLARALAALLPGSGPFVELPIGATEDRLVGTIDLRAALSSGERHFHPGLLSACDGGVLYVDEVNLLPDHLVDLLLDVAASGVNRVEREGISHEHPSRFVLIGSMNPEEGELRPQLLDRFGLAVDVRTSADAAERALAVERRIAFDADPAGVAAEWERNEDALRRQLATLSRPASFRPLAPELARSVSELCATVGAEGLRADLVICRAAAALARWEGRSTADAQDVRRVAPLALAHRRRSPLGDGGIDGGDLEEALERLEEGDPGADKERVAPVGDAGPVPGLGGAEPFRSAGQASGRRRPSEGPRGRLVGDRRPEGQDGAVRSVALGATAAAAASRRTGGSEGDAGPGGGRGELGEPAVLVEPEDLREAVREQRTANLVVLVVDASGSMGVGRRMEAAKGAVLSLLLDAYQRRDRVALVTFRGESAEVVLQPTGSVEVARARLASLPTGGRTPLAAGIGVGLQVAERARSGAYRPLVVVVSDGRATAGPAGSDPVAAAQDAAAGVRRRGVASVVVDAEEGPVRLGLARSLAETMAARYVTVDELSAGAVSAAVRSRLT